MCQPAGAWGSVMAGAQPQVGKGQHTPGQCGAQHRPRLESSRCVQGLGSRRARQEVDVVSPRLPGAALS